METLDLDEMSSLQRTLTELVGSSGDLRRLYSEVKRGGKVTARSLTNYLYDKADLSTKAATSLKKLFPGFNEIPISEFCTKLGDLQAAGLKLVNSGLYSSHLEGSRSHVSIRSPEDFTTDWVSKGPRTTEGHSEFVFEDQFLRKIGDPKSSRNDDWDDWPELTNFSMKYHDVSSARDDASGARKSKHLDWEFEAPKSEPQQHAENLPFDFEQQWREIEHQDQLVYKRSFFAKKPKSTVISRAETYSALSELRSRYIKASTGTTKSPLNEFLSSRNSRYPQRHSSIDEYCL